MNATPEQLQMMLYDGALFFTEMAREGLLHDEEETSAEGFRRAEAILHELTQGLRPDLAPEICGQMAELYDFCLKKLFEGAATRSEAPVREASRILEHLAETWRLVLDRLGQPRLEAFPAEELETVSALVQV